jgi:hypothetical protein
LLPQLTDRNEPVKGAAPDIWLTTLQLILPFVITPTAMIGKVDDAPPTITQMFSLQLTLLSCPDGRPGMVVILQVFPLFVLETTTGLPELLPIATHTLLLEQLTLEIEVPALKPRGVALSATHVMPLLPVL